MVLYNFEVSVTGHKHSEIHLSDLSFDSKQNDFFFSSGSAGTTQGPPAPGNTDSSQAFCSTCVLLLTLVSQLCVYRKTVCVFFSTGSRVRGITAHTPCQHSNHPPASCSWHFFFPRNNSGNTGTSKKLSTCRSRGQNYCLWGGHFLATVRNKMSQQQEELGPAAPEDELGTFSSKGSLGKQAGGGKKTLGDKKML